MSSTVSSEPGGYLTLTPISSLVTESKAVLSLRWGWGIPVLHWSWLGGLPVHKLPAWWDMESATRKMPQWVCSVTQAEISITLTCLYNLVLEICPWESLGKVCLPPVIPDDMILYPKKDEYRVGDLLGLNCNQQGLFPQPHSSFTCGNSLTWEPPLPPDLRCTDGTVDGTALLFNENISETANFSLLS